MGTQIGRNASLGIGDSISGPFTLIGKLNAINPANSVNMADETTNDSEGWIEEQYADGQMSISPAGKWDSADAGQLALGAANHDKVQKFFRMRPSTGAGQVEFTFKANIPEFNIDTETGAVEDLGATITSSGVVTRTIQ